MHFEPPIRRVSIEAFRGFRDRQEFEIAASAVILSGPNGTGKTSFFDALQWALIGRIERLEAVRARPTVEHIVNQYRLDGRATVEIEMAVGERQFRIRRVGDHRRSTLELADAGEKVLFGDEAEAELKKILVPNPGITLEMALTTSGLLQQDVMRAVLQARPADRYRHISSVLGLSELEDFEAAVKEAVKKANGIVDAARAERDSATTALQAARVQLQRSEEQQLLRVPVEAVLTEIGQLLGQPPTLLRLDLREPLRSEIVVAALARDVGRLADDVRDLVEAEQRLGIEKSALGPEPDPALIPAAEVAVTAAQAEVGSRTEAVRNARRIRDAAQKTSDEMARLAAAAIPLLSPKCPVCGQDIDPADVERRLRGNAAAGDTLIGLQKSLDAALEGERVAVTTYEGALAGLSTLMASRSAWQGLAERRVALDERLLSITKEESQARLIADGIDEVIAGADTLLEYLALLRRRLLEAADVFAQSSTTGLIDRSAAEVKSFDEVVAARNRRLEEVSQRATLLRNLAVASVDARVEVTERRFRAIQPLVADIFSRLDPHPAFKTIEFELDTYYRKGTTSPLVRDVVENVSADPLVVFSTSQANIAALSYFLAMGWTAGNRSMPFVLLDDPLQSMDDVNVLGFADLCRHIRSTRQLLISTHEKRLSGLLERKLAPRGDVAQTLILEFVGWDRSGPTVERRLIEPQLLERPIRLVQSAS